MGASKLLHRIWDCDLWPWPLTFATKCYSFAICNPISILFALCDSTRWELQNLYTEFWPLTPLTFDLHIWPILYILLQNATPLLFLTRFRICLLYVIALGEGFKTSTQNFDLWLPWPLTLIFDLYCTLATKCYFFAFSNPISNLSALCDSTRWGLQNFYTKFWSVTFDLLLQNATKCFSFAISNLISILFALCYSTRWGLQNLYTEFWPFTLLTFDLNFCPILYIGYKMLLLPNF